MADKKEFDKSGKIDLSAKDGMKFDIKEGKCKSCKGTWPVMSNIELCQACILIYLPSEVRGKEIIVPDSYMKKEGDENTCTVCFESIIDKNIFHCTVCFESTCIDCVKKIQAGDGRRNCPVCRSEFRMEEDA